MPTERFNNLSEEKRLRILNAIKTEISRVPLDELSINQIVQNAGIPRGSFYQYFEDKKDLVLYILDEYLEQMQMRLSLAADSADLFCVIKAAFDFTMEYGFAPENFPLMRNIFCCLRAGETGSLQVIQQRGKRMIEKFGHKIDISRLNVTCEADVLNMISIVLNILYCNVASVFLNPDSREEIHGSFLSKLEILKHGMYIREET